MGSIRSIGILRNTIEQLKAEAEKEDKKAFSVVLSHGDAEIICYALDRCQPCQMAGEPIVDDTESRSPYHSTVAGMLSPDYKERFKAEYQQTKIRYEKLKAFCNRIEAAMRTCPGDTKRVEMPAHDCPLDLLRDQQRAMGEYLHCLEIRAVIEGIDL
jgi:hypothetical protein